MLPARRGAGAHRPGGDIHGGHGAPRAEHVRHTLNLESGLNDGLALPLVLFFLVLAVPGGDAFEAGASWSARSRWGR